MPRPDCFIVDTDDTSHHHHQLNSFGTMSHSFNHQPIINTYRTYESNVDPGSELLANNSAHSNINSLKTQSASSSALSSPGSSTPSSPTSSTADLDYSNAGGKHVSNTNNPNDYEMVHFFVTIQKINTVSSR